MILHRWEYNHAMCWYVCIPPEKFSVPDKDRCHGCGAVVTDQQLVGITRGEDPGVITHALLNFIMWARTTDRAQVIALLSLIENSVGKV